jgi:hypothetical protein
MICDVRHISKSPDHRLYGFQYIQLFQKAAFDACARQLFGSFKTTAFEVAWNGSSTSSW